MFIAKDSQAIRNPWLTFQFNQWLWGPNKDKAFKFATEEEALAEGRRLMSGPKMEQRIIAEPA